jgi:hypothetical protein
MRVAYLVLAHRYPAQLARLVARLQPTGDVFVHIDRKATDHFTGLEGAYVVPEHQRHAVWWGGFSMIRATLALAQVALRDQYDYYSLLSGQCYPIKPLKEFVGYLAANQSAEYMVYIDLYREWPAMAFRFNRYFFERRSLITRVLNRLARYVPGLRRMPAGLVPKLGWQWWTLTHEALAYLVEAFARRPELSRYFRHSINACEVSLQTVMGSSCFHSRVNRTPTHEIEFAPGSPHPKVWTSVDLPRLLASPAFFARKFDQNVDARVLDLLDDHLRTGVPHYA